MGTDFEASSAISRMDTISLEEMDSVKLMNRIDTKYVTTEEKLLQVFERAADCGYRVCEIMGRRVTGYDSMYYDTPTLEMFRIHRSGKYVRQKVRVRTYLVSGVTFLEIKRKNNKGRTRKKRMKLDGKDIAGTAGAAEFLAGNSWYTLEGISPACTTFFNRITLVNKEKTERITFDTALGFSNPRTGRSAGLRDAVIIEVKQDGRADSKIGRILLDLRIHPFKVSKYCIGTILTDTSLHRGRFKEKVRGIEKIIGKDLEKRIS